MQLSFAAPGSVSAGAWVVGATEGAVLTPAAQKADAACGGAVSRSLKVSRFTGKPGQALEILAPAGMKASRIVLVGLGKASGFDANAAENTAADMIGRLSKAGESSVTIEIDALKVPS